MEFYISPQSGQFYMINVLENQWLSVTYRMNMCCSNFLARFFLNVVVYIYILCCTHRIHIITDDYEIKFENDLNELIKVLH